jgi:hypothetical protein
VRLSCSIHASSTSPKSSRERWPFAAEPLQAPRHWPRFSKHSFAAVAEELELNPAQVEVLMDAMKECEAMKGPHALFNESECSSPTCLFSAKILPPYMPLPS